MKGVGQVIPMEAQILQNSRNHLKSLGARWVTWKNAHSDDSQILGTP